MLPSHVHGNGCWRMHVHGSYQRMEGRSHTAEERISMHSHRPHASSQPSLFSHTHNLTSAAQLAQPLPLPHTHVPSRHQHRQCKASTVTQLLLTPHDQPTPAVHLTVPPLHRHRQQLHCPAHKCTLGNAPTVSCDVPKAVHELHRLLAHVPARLNRKRHKPESSMIRHILPEPCPLGLFSPRRSPPSCLGCSR